MKKITLFAFLLTALFWACSKVPLTNRKQLLLFSDSEINQQSFLTYKSFLDTSKVVAINAATAQMVKRVGDNIAKAAQKYFNDNNMNSYLEGYQWETNLVQSPEINAWCMPGGKMVVYTGILPTTMNETGLAVVMGHEVSHAIAKHGNERMSEGALAQGLLMAGQIGLGVAMQNKPQETQNLWNQIFGLAAPAGAQLGLLAHGRNQESEADHLGLIFMAIAGYNPQEATQFWGRMSKLSGNAQKPPQFLSTHPSDETRIRQITDWLPDAMKYYTPPAPMPTAPSTPVKNKTSKTGGRL